jgi:hypothetical protein
MTIEILRTQTDILEPTGETFRSVEIIITNGAESYLWSRGGLPAEGDLQTILEAEESRLWREAQAGGRAVDLYELALKRVLKAFALVVMDEINILRNRAGLQPRNAGQIDDAIRAKLKEMAR